MTEPIETPRPLSARYTALQQPIRHNSWKPDTSDPPSSGPPAMPADQQCYPPPPRREPPSPRPCQGWQGPVAAQHSQLEQARHLLEYQRQWSHKRSEEHTSELQ